MRYNVTEPESLNGKPRNPASDSEVKPKKATRRNFTAKQKLKVLEETDNLGRGELGAYLRKKGIYSSSLSSWRKQREQGLLDGLKPKKRGAPTKSPEARRLAELERQITKLEKKLAKAGLIIDAQKKLCELFGVDSMTGEELK